MNEQKTLPNRSPQSFIRFLGTGGSRFTVMSQLRASGGLWFQWGEMAFSIDPGPGSLVRMHQNTPPLDPGSLDGILLSHKHLDHSSDLNVLVEAMTGGGFTKRGILIAPSDALNGEEKILYSYLKPKISKIYSWRDGEEYSLSPDGKLKVEGVSLMHHGVECYGMIFREGNEPLWGLISDTKLESHWIKRFSGCSVLVINMTLSHKRANLDHLSPEDVKVIVEELNPALTIITHFGRGVLKEGPCKIAERLSINGHRIVPAEDGLIVNLGKFSDNI